MKMRSFQLSENEDEDDNNDGASPSWGFDSPVVIFSVSTLLFFSFWTKNKTKILICSLIDILEEDESVQWFRQWKQST